MPCMYDSWDLNYKFPFGAIRRRSDCNFTIYLPAGVTPDFPPVMVLFRTGFKERFLPMNANGEQDGCKCYTVTYSPKYAGVHYYYFAYTSNGVRHYIKRGTAHEAALDRGELYQLTVFAKHYETPNFLKGGIRFSLTDSARAESRMKMFRMTGYCGTTGMAHRTTSRMQTDTFGTMTISAAIWRVSAASSTTSKSWVLPAFI